MKKKLLKAKYRGELKFGDSIISCAVLENGTRVLSETGITKAILGQASGSGASQRLKAKAKEVGTLLPLFIAPSQLIPFIPNDLDGDPLTLINYDDNNKEMTGYKAEILPIICDIWLQARESNALLKSQLPKAYEAEILMRSLAKVGIIALVDEATGYQFDFIENED